MVTEYQAQNQLKHIVDRYFNGCALSGWDRVIATGYSGLPCRFHAKALSQRYLDVRALVPVLEQHQEISVTPYAGNNQYVKRMQSSLAHLGEDLIGACVHGSLGTFEEVPYSDFDALVIVRGEVFEDPARLRRCAEKLGQLRRVMFEFDPLQHHGWFVLTELDLNYYCDAYFPVELFSHAKSILGSDPLTLTVSPRDSTSEIRSGFFGLANSILRNIEVQNQPTTMYQLKCVTSTIMLLPALYLHARHGAGVYKRETFDLAKQDFSPEDWAVMDEVSRVREDWTYELSWLQRYALTHALTLRKYAVHRLSPGIPKELASKLDASFYKAIEVLVNRMVAALEAGH